MKVSAIFTDYDGTIAPLDAGRGESAVPPALFAVLKRISSVLPVAVITSKDVSFVRPRTGFAWAWAGALGLELRLRDGSGRLAAVSAELSLLMPRAKALLPPEVIVEEKRGSDGRLLGVSLDWKGLREEPVRELEAATKLLAGRGFPVYRYPAHRFTDIYAAPADKGAAFRSLVEMLGVRRPIMYLGDMATDNEAFDSADIPICVGQRGESGELHCKYSVRFEEVEDMLAGLLEDGFEFDGVRPAIEGGPETT